METAGTISDFDIPQKLQVYIKNNYPKGEISYCEKVVSPESSGFVRVNLIANGKLIIMQSEINGSNIKITKAENEQ